MLDVTFRNRLFEILLLTVVPCQMLVTEKHCLSCVYNTVRSSGRQTEQAIQMFRRAIGLKHNFPDAHCGLGTVLQEKGQLDQAEECYNQALRLQPDHAESLINLGKLKEEQGHGKEAIVLYRKALKVSTLEHLNGSLTLKKLPMLQTVIG